MATPAIENKNEKLPRPPMKIMGILGLLIMACVVTSILSDRFTTPYNIENLIRRISLFGIISIGVAFVIIAGGIDLSIGSVVALIGCFLPWLLMKQGWSVGAALLFLLALSAFIGLSHGLLITKLKIQPFIVTLCGLLLYRGLARTLTRDQTQGFGNDFEAMRQLATGKIAIPFVSGFTHSGAVYYFAGYRGAGSDIPQSHHLRALFARSGAQRTSDTFQRHQYRPHDDFGLCAFARFWPDLAAFYSS